MFIDLVPITYQISTEKIKIFGNMFNLRIFIPLSLYYIVISYSSFDERKNM